MTEPILVIFLDQTGAKSVKAKISPTVTVRKILPNIITKMALPTIAPDGTPLSYALDHKEGGTRLTDTDTLPGAGVGEGHHLIVYPEITAGSNSITEEPIDPENYAELDKRLHMMDRLAKSEHAKRCPICKSIALMIGYCLNETTIEFGIELLIEHAQVPLPGFPKCAEELCILHDRINADVAHTIMKLARWGIPKKINHLDKAEIHFECTESNRPKGFKIHDPSGKKWHHTMRPMNTAGGIDIQIKRNYAAIHLILDFDGPEPGAFEGAKPVEVFAETVKKNLENYSKWTLLQYHDLRSLAEMELTLKPISKRRMAKKNPKHKKIKK